jgi:predicted transcriptional regulator
MKSPFTKNTDAKPIKVMNVMTAEYQVFMNGYDLATNLISAIIMSTEDSRKLLDLDYRDKIREEAKIEYIVTKQGVKKVYSPAYDMIAFESQDQEVISS